MRGREYIVSLKPCGRGILLETLRYADEVVKAQGYFRDIPDAKPDAEMLELAETLIDEEDARNSIPAKFHDRYVDALQELIEKKRKLKGGKIEAEEEETAEARLQRHRPDGGAEESIEKPGAKAAAAKKAPAKKAPARKAAPARKRA